MSSWVVPTVAAELWGVSVDRVLEMVRAGSATAREEFGFLWVEAFPGPVAPQPIDAPPTAAPRVRRVRRRGRAKQATFTARSCSARSLDAGAVDVEPADSDGARILTESARDQVLNASEIEALAGGPASSAVGEIDPPEPDECESPEDPDDGVPMNWRQSRARTALTRRPPGTR